jgi:hypothetical protein
MHFDSAAITRLIQDVGPAWLMSRSSSVRGLRKLVADADELAPVLRLYPQVKYEPLDSHYLLLKHLAVMDVQVVEDLMAAHPWKGPVVAALLVCLRPRSDYLPHFQREAMRVHARSQWILQLAVEVLSKNASPSDLEAHALVSRLRELLMCVELPTWSLPRAPTPEQGAARDREKAVIRQAYRTQGLDAALALSARLHCQPFQSHRNIHRLMPHAVQTLVAIRYHRNSKPWDAELTRCPAWSQVEEAIRRMDDRFFPIVAQSALECASDEALFEDDESLHIIGGNGRFALFQNGGPWQYSSHNGSTAPVHLWQSDQGYFCEEHNVATLEMTLRLAKLFHETSSFQALESEAVRAN